jgi:hypothetical protein
MTEDTNVIRNYGNLLDELCNVVPDGLVGFFPNFEYMEDYILRWKQMGLLNRIMKNKVLFVESRINIPKNYIQNSIVCLFNIHFTFYRTYKSSRKLVTTEKEQCFYARQEEK